MTLNQFIEQLHELQGEGHGDSIIVLSKDGEGNDFSPFAELGNYFYKANSTWSGEICNEDEKEAHPGDFEDYNQKAIVLWPTN